MGLVLLMWMSTLRMPSTALGLRSCLRMPDCGRCPMSRARFFDNSKSNHFVVGPECAIDHQAIRLVQERPEMRFDLAKTGCIEERLVRHAGRRFASRYCHRRAGYRDAESTAAVCSLQRYAP